MSPPTTRDGDPNPQPDEVGRVDDIGSLPPGTRLGEFELIRVLGDGGFGVVYLAQDHSLGRIVALKEYMPSSLARRSGMNVALRSAHHAQTFAAGLRSFVNEAQLLARFDHPALVKVYRFWEGNGTAYMVMPYYEGVTLKDRLREMGSPPGQAWLGQLLVPLIEALATIHGERCYHRDISPDNIILLAGSGRPLLLDFGAARRVISDMTQALTVIVKPGYAPLEQYADMPGARQGPWTDVYAVCAVVHYAITGRTPPPAVGRVMNDTFGGLAEYVYAGYTSEFLQAIERGLRVRPEERTPSVEQLAKELGLRLPVDLEIGDGALMTAPLLPPIAPPRSADERSRDAPADAAVDRVAHDAYARTVAAPAPARIDARTVVLPSKRADAQPSAAPVADGAMRRGRRNERLWLSLAATALLFGLAGSWLALRERSDGAIGGPAQTREAATPRPAATEPVPPSTQVGADSAKTLPVPVQAPPPTPAQRIAREFDRIEAARHADYQVRATADAPRLRIGRDLLAFTVSSNRDGYLYVLVHGPDDSVLLVYPNKVVADNRIRAGEALRLPQKSWPLEASDPAGMEHFVAIVSAHPRDFSALRPVAEGWFQKLALENDAPTAADRGPLLAGNAACADAGCDRFGTARFSVTVERP